MSMELSIFLLFSMIILDWTNGSLRKETREDGYVIAIADDNSPTSSAEILGCPSKNVIRVKYKCLNTGGKWIDCIRPQCCPGFNFIGGKCTPRDIDPCMLNLCEQRCDVISRRVVCTCWSGYRFSQERQKNGVRPACIDVDECSEGTHDCQQICVNSPGEYSCKCREGFTLRKDNKTCEGFENFSGNEGGDRCSASCETVSLLQRMVRRLQEKVTALETAVKVSIHPSPLTETRGRNSLNEEIHVASAGYSDDSNDKTYTVLDSFVQSGGGFCKCQRGPVGPPGAPGITGQKGDPGERGLRGHKGNAGNFDFLLLLLADVRHDIVLLQERVFPGETLPKFDIETVLKKQRSIEVPNFRRDGIQDFEGTKTLGISDYSMGDGPESSGDEMDQY